MVNEACVADSYDERIERTGGFQGENDCSTATVTVTPKVDLKMNKDVDVTSGATVGDTLEFTLSVTNNGPSAANVVGFTDTFDAGLTDIALVNLDADWDCERLAAERDGLFPPTPVVDW